MLKNDKSSTTGNSNIPSEVMRKEETFIYCNDFFIPKKAQFTAIDTMVLDMK